MTMTLRDRLRELLRKRGPLSRHEIVKALGSSADGALSALRKTGEVESFDFLNIRGRPARRYGLVAHHPPSPEICPSSISLDGSELEWLAWYSGHRRIQHRQAAQNLRDRGHLKLAEYEQAIATRLAALQGKLLGFDDLDSLTQ